MSQIAISHKPAIIIMTSLARLSRLRRSQPPFSLWRHYAQQRFRLGTVWWQTRGRPPGPPSTSPGWGGGTAPMLL